MSETENTPQPRVPLMLDVGYRRSYGRDAVKGQVKNISLSGAFLIHSGHDLKANDKICLEFRVGGRARKVHAVIVWTKPEGCGLRFVPHNNRDVQIVDDLIYFVENSRERRRDVLDKIFKQVV